MGISNSCSIFFLIGSISTSNDKSGPVASIHYYSKKFLSTSFLMTGSHLPYHHYFDILNQHKIHLSMHWEQVFLLHFHSFVKNFRKMQMLLQQPLCCSQDAPLSEFLYSLQPLSRKLHASHDAVSVLVHFCFFYDDEDEELKHMAKTSL